MARRVVLVEPLSPEAAARLEKATAPGSLLSRACLTIRQLVEEEEKRRGALIEVQKTMARDERKRLVARAWRLGVAALLLGFGLGVVVGLAL